MNNPYASSNQQSGYSSSNQQTGFTSTNQQPNGCGFVVPPATGYSSGFGNQHVSTSRQGMFGGYQQRSVEPTRTYPNDNSCCRIL